jgi:hypothetical protein
LHELKHPFVLGSACGKVEYQDFSTGIYLSVQGLDGVRYMPVVFQSYCYSDLPLSNSLGCGYPQHDNNVPLLPYQNTILTSKTMVELKNTVQNERYVSGIFDKK